MSIQRVPPVPFTQIANSALRDKRLSFKARGLLALVLSNVGEWNATLTWLESQSDHDGRVAIQAALNELTEHGYRSVHQESDKRGRLQTVVTWRHAPELSITRPAENPTDGKPDQRKTRAPIEEHSLEHHSSEQQVTDNPDADFDEFWKAYPRKESKGQARTAFKRAAKKVGSARLIAAAVEYRQWCEREGTEKRFIPHGSTWLNGEKWDDERVSTQEPDRMQGHLAHIRDLWETGPVENPRQLEG